jgi:conjugative transfer signal peptidase TraF
LRADSIAAATVAAVIAALIWPPCLLLVWNTTPSIPIGLYVITPAPPRRGDLSVMRLPRQMETLAVARAILTSHIPVLKPVAAAAGDLVCRSGRAVTINGHLVAIARHVDRKGRALPTWQGCRRLSGSQVFILARHPHSFDSRYYGPLQLNLSRGVAHPLVTFSNGRQ